MEPAGIARDRMAVPQPESMGQQEIPVRWNCTGSCTTAQRQAQARAVLLHSTACCPELLGFKTTGFTED